MPRESTESSKKKFLTRLQSCLNKEIEIVLTWGEVSGKLMEVDEGSLVVRRVENREIKQPSTTVINGEPAPEEVIKEIIEIDLTLKLIDVNAFSTITRKVTV